MSKTRKPQAETERILREVVRQFQAAFYPETLKGVPAGQPNPFYQDLRLLRQAATYPARHIRDFGSGEFPVERYEGLFRVIIAKMKGHGRTPAQIAAKGRRGAYILHCVQDHMRHNWETLAPLSKAAAELIDEEFRSLAIAGQAPSATERPIQALAALSDLLTVGRPKTAKLSIKAKPPQIQSELF